jgi:hypothetical protein
MRLTSALFVAAHLRRCYAEGSNAVVIRRGADEAGAIFFLVDRLNETVDLYGPAPQTAFSDSSRPTDRLFQLIAEGKPFEEVNRRLEREARFDPDLWIVAIEDRHGRSYLDLAPA